MVQDDDDKEQEDDNVSLSFSPPRRACTNKGAAVDHTSDDDDDDDDGPCKVVTHSGVWGNKRRGCHDDDEWQSNDELDLARVVVVEATGGAPSIAAAAKVVGCVFAGRLPCRRRRLCGR